ncbi:energy-coupling factor ABC transporter permease [Nitrincola alkalilacustris]|uniref:energy-coupling factor ABC transporter permease n=1 Tax=Nitrincola alkalilacustris TaxID=1571224 RepID=UPI00124D1A76|nr:energy-coupling factor ABC transporter permease [Nitrincola alkalilacustris]
MGITTALLSPVWIWSAHLLLVLLLIPTLLHLPWSVLLRERGIQHLLFGSAMILVLMWSFRAGISPGLSIHFLGMTALTLMFGWDLAIVAGLLALAGLTLTGRESWELFSLNGLCMVVLPALISYGVLRLVERRLPKNFFIYMFLCAFLGAGVAIAGSGLSYALILWLDDVYPWSRIYQEYIILLPLIMLPEGLLNGIIMTGMMVFHPDWIRTFDARAYIDDQ